MKCLQYVQILVHLFDCGWIPQLYGIQWKEEIAQRDENIYVKLCVMNKNNINFQ